MNIEKQVKIASIKLLMEAIERIQNEIADGEISNVEGCNKIYKITQEIEEIVAIHAGYR
jgi:hypothetical protein